MLTLPLSPTMIFLSTKMFPKGKIFVFRLLLNDKQNSRPVGETAQPVPDPGAGSAVIR
jgi:hypothetical protein